ncbi:MAG: hypothetical protein QXO70_02470 [Candidatus Pacearchaeota archaeon]
MEKILVFRNRLHDECIDGEKEDQEFIIVKNKDGVNQIIEENKNIDVEEYYFDISEHIFEDILRSIIIFINKDEGDNYYKIVHYLLKGSKKFLETEKEIKLNPGQIYAEEIIKDINLTPGRYDERILIYKNNVKKKSFTRKIEISEKEKSNATQNESQASIKSFYTLAKKFDGEINFFANIERGMNNLIFFAKISEDIRSNINYSEKVIFKANVSNGLNLFILGLLDENNNLIDVKLLRINGNKTFEIKNETTKLEKLINEEINEEISNNKNNPSKNKEMDLTGKAIYSSKTKTVTKYLNYALIPILVILIYVFVWWIHEKKQNKRK